MSIIKTIIRDIRYLVKSADYAHEQEMRILVRRHVLNMKKYGNDIKTTVP